MKLHYDPLSTTSRAVTFFLYDQAIAFDEAVVSLHQGDQRRPEFLALNPNGQVPVLEDGDFVLTESAAILRHVARRTGSAAWPEDVRGQARVDEALSWFESGLNTYFCKFSVYPRMLPELLALPEGSRADLQRLGAQGTQRYLDVLDRTWLAKAPFVCGEAITLADYFGAAILTLGFVIDFDFSAWPNVAAWLERLKRRPGWDPAFASFCGFLIASRREMAEAGA
ncbi:MAG TPA: glutathione S-transferase family protein [Caulobacteraceae bacterium]|nr:glutathione S-transferase family protein [Caulobacteraceae bacterium]